MKVTRLYTGNDGESHFEDIDYPLTEVEPAEWRSEIIKAEEVFFRNSGSNYDTDFHNSPRKSLVINLEGYVDITVGDGSKRRFGPGSIILCEDISGRGHKSCAVNNQPRESIFINLIS
jgi:hypothetical protein